MSERLRESVSALMDGEAGELELRRLLTDSDELSVRSSWQSYHRLQVVLKEQPAEFFERMAFNPLASLSPPFDS